MKSCPSCSSQFPDSSNFCEFDGEALESPESLRTGSRGEGATSEEGSLRATLIPSHYPTLPVSEPPPDVPIVDHGLSVREALRDAPVVRLIEIAREAVNLAIKFDNAELAWQPQAEDFVVDSNGHLAIMQARGVARKASPLDVRGVLRSLGEALAPFPLVSLPTYLVRSLLDPRSRRLSAEAALAELTVKNVERADDPTAVDIGFERERQEDAARVVTLLSKQQETVRVAVLCDGVSMSADGGLAARIGSDAALTFAKEKIAEREDDAAIVKEAIFTAHQRICEQSTWLADDVDPPGTTIVVAIVRSEQATIAWLGDSRAYLCHADGTGELVTRDHSWKNEVARWNLHLKNVGVDSTVSPLERGAMSSALTRCLGPLEGPADANLEIDVESRSLPAGSALVICSDGLWSYFSAPEEMASIVKTLEKTSETELAECLVNHALIRGGDDNVSVIALRSSQP